MLQPPDDVVGYLTTAARVFPIGTGSDPEGARGSRAAHPRIDGIHAFLDDLSAPRLGHVEWARLADHHLRRVSLNVVSGAPEVRALLGRVWEDDALRAAVIALKRAGIGVGLIVLVGAGGADHAQRHLQTTADLINSLDLGPGDLVSLLDANEWRDPGSALGETKAVIPLTGPAWLEQQARLKERLAPVRTVRKAKVVPYSLEKRGTF